jgi:hypothetical protein
MVLNSLEQLEQHRIESVIGRLDNVMSLMRIREHVSFIKAVISIGGVNQNKQRKQPFDFLHYI